MQEALTYSQNSRTGEVKLPHRVMLVEAVVTTAVETLPESYAVALMQTTYSDRQSTVFHR